ncbi:uncharacterized protein BJ171DRAFT_595023 [Polychytrium aggregatum]|uniref:uncharacterized protein n=1 Tax=Polychytrium aggregatum TaxID=110093 RepID=UPI0022FDB5ED|nr:uncharacterized protein BJ171DRAFT_595023 [Polychytrium aggregatum]KAI9209254.1 hypothetical protein BJ171DRAFT_595023 [Polychytrium aggregatum]
MGNAHTKPADPVVLYNEPDIPITFSPNLLFRLDQIQNPNAAPSPKPAHNHDVDDVVHERVQRAIEKEKQQRLFFEERSADQVRREAEDLLRRQKRVPEQHVNAEYQQLQNAVIDCYRNNTARALDCWKEVADFKGAAKKAQHDFVSTH